MRRSLTLLLTPAVLMGLAGLGLGCPLVALQAANPAGHILTVGQYQAYSSFYLLGPHLAQLSWLGLGASALVMVLLALWCGSQFRDDQEGLVLLGARQIWLLGMISLQWLLWSYTAKVCQPGEALWSRLDWLPLIVWGISIVRMTFVRWTPPLATRAVVLFVWILLLPVLTAGSGGAPPFLWTHFGPWQLIGWQMAACFSLGLAMGVGVCGLGSEDRGFALAAAIVVVTLMLGLRSLLADRYQIGQDLRETLALEPQSVEARSVVWLNRPQPAELRVPAQSWLGGANLPKLETWLAAAPVPSAQTRGAVAALGNRALWDWEPDRALEFLLRQRSAQIHNSQLNDALVSLLMETSPSPLRQKVAAEFAEPERFAWPGAEPLSQVAGLLGRLGRPREERTWLDTARQLDGRERIEAVAPTAFVEGRIVMPGARSRVALLRGSEDSARAWLAEEGGLLTNEGLWKARNRPCLDLAHLGGFYAVAETDAHGRFRLGPLDAGSYLALARVADSAADLRVQGGTGEIRVVAGQTLELGDLDIR